MKVVLTEEQYRMVLKEGFGEQVKNKLSKSSEFLKKVVSDVTQQLKFDFRFLLTYGAGIGAILQSVFDYLEGNFQGLDQNQIAGLAIMAIAVVFYENKDYREQIDKLESEDLGGEFRKVVRHTQRLREKFAHLLNVLGLSVHRTSNILSYSFLVPLLSILISVVTEHGVNSDQFEMFVESLATSAMIAIPGVAIRDILYKAAEIIQRKGLK